MARRKKTWLLVRKVVGNDMVLFADIYTFVMVRDLPTPVICN